MCLLKRIPLTYQTVIVTVLHIYPVMPDLDISCMFYCDSVQNLFKTLDPSSYPASKASGPDNIPTRILKINFVQKRLL